MKEDEHSERLKTAGSIYIEPAGSLSKNPSFQAKAGITI